MCLLCSVAFLPSGILCVYEHSIQNLPRNYIYLVLDWLRFLKMLASLFCRKSSEDGSSLWMPCLPLLFQASQTQLEHLEARRRYLSILAPSTSSCLSTLLLLLKIQKFRRFLPDLLAKSATTLAFLPRPACRSRRLFSTLPPDATFNMDYYLTKHCQFSSGCALC